MVTPAEIAALIEQAWSLDPEENFFEFLYDVLQTNGTLFSLGEATNDEIKKALDAYIAAGGVNATEEIDTSADSGDTQGNTPS